MSSHALTPSEGANPAERAQHRAVRQLIALMEEIAACRAEIHRKDTAAAELEKRLQRDVGAQEGQWIAARAEIFRALGRHLHQAWLPRKSHKILRDAVSALADELEKEYGVDLQVERRVYLGEEEEEAAEEEIFYSGRRGRAETGSAQEGPRGEAREEGGIGNTEDTVAPGARPGRPGSKAARKRESKDRALAGDIRALYLILARALHPDKEPNPSLREAKTIWMQKVTSAYARKDLAMLLDILARNPLEAVGPYLDEAPLRTVMGFAKRLRKELAVLKGQAAKAGEWLHPFYARFLKDGSVDEGSILRHIGELKRAVKLAKQRRDVYRTRAGAEQLVEGLKAHSWRDLL